MQALNGATSALDPPFAVVDLDAFDANAADLLRRAGGVPVRLASKSGLALDGMLACGGQSAGVGHRPPGTPLLGLGVRAMQGLSARELAQRRAAIVAAVREVAPLRFVNGGGTGSIERTAAEPAVTEVAGGAGRVRPAPVGGGPPVPARPGAAVGAPAGAPALPRVVGRAG